MTLALALAVLLAPAAGAQVLSEDGLQDLAKAAREAAAKSSTCRMKDEHFYPVAKRDAAAEALLWGMVARLDANAARAIRVVVMTDPKAAYVHPADGSAMVDPDPLGQCHYFIVDAGMIRLADNDSQLAGVFGHELGHMRLMHRGTSDDMLGHAAQRLYEEQADAEGVKLAAKAGYDPLGLAGFFGNYYRPSRPADPIHPAVGQRVERLEYLASKAVRGAARPPLIRARLRALGY